MVSETPRKSRRCEVDSVRALPWRLVGAYIRRSCRAGGARRFVLRPRHAARPSGPYAAGRKRRRRRSRLATSAAANSRHAAASHAGEAAQHSRDRLRHAGRYPDDARHYYRRRRRRGRALRGLHQRLSCTARRRAIHGRRRVSRPQGRARSGAGDDRAGEAGDGGRSAGRVYRAGGVLQAQGLQRRRGRDDRQAADADARHLPLRDGARRVRDRPARGRRLGPARAVRDEHVVRVWLAAADPRLSVAPLDAQLDLDVAHLRADRPVRGGLLRGNLERAQSDRQGRRGGALRMRRLRHLVSRRALYPAALRARAPRGRRIAMAVVDAVAAGFVQAASFFWDSLFGLIFGFLVSAIVQVMLTPATMHRYLGPGLKGLLYGAGFGIISSACSYGAAAAARGFYRSGADVRSIFAFLISSTNMNVAIVILFWSLLGWRFAFAEFFGGVIIIAVVTAGFSLLFRQGELARMQAEHARRRRRGRRRRTDPPQLGRGRFDGD